MADIFISYKREDRPLANMLALELVKFGWTVWWDHELLGGEDYDVAIDKELTAAACVIVIWSALSQGSRNVKDEARKALNRGRLVPVSFDHTEPPLGFGMTHVVEFAPGRYLDDEALAKLRQSIEKKVKPDDAHVPVTPVVPKPSFNKAWLLLPLAVLVLIFIMIFRNNKQRGMEADRQRLVETAQAMRADTNLNSPGNQQEPTPVKTDMDKVMDYFSGRNALQPRMDGDTITYYRIKEIKPGFIKLDVDYSFNSNHGQVFLGGWLTPLGDEGVASGYNAVSLPPGSGTVEITLTITPPATPKQSTGILLFMLESYKSPFSIHLFPYTHEWGR